MEEIYNQNIVHNVLKSNEPDALDDMLSIEDLVIEIKKMNKKKIFYKQYKDKKNNDIDIEVKKIDNRIDFFKQVIIKTLQKNEENSISFPGSCKIIKRASKGKWNILDEEKFMEFLKEEEEYDNIVKIETKNVIQKKPLNTLLNSLNKSGDIPDCINKDPDTVSLSIQFIEDTNEDDNIVKEDNVILEKDDYDKLDFS